MGTKWGREDDEQLARLLAPVLGEMAVYTYTFRCPGCHKETVSTNSLPTYCSEIHGGRTVWMTCYAEPVHFADPAVGWPLFERWLRDSLTDVEIIALSDGFVVNLDVKDNNDVTSRYIGEHDPLWRALLAAWRAAVEAEVPHGE